MSMHLDLPKDEAFCNDLLRKGFDICVPLRPEWYNDLVDSEGLDLMRLPTDNVESAYLIGNTKMLWGIFVDWCRSMNNLPSHPLDQYTQQKLQAAVDNRQSSKSSRIYWSSTSSPEKLVSMQRVSVVSGCAYHDCSTQLTIHPNYGTWISYRAVVIFFGEGEFSSTRTPLLPPPPRVPKLLYPEEEARAKAAMQYALAVSDTSKLCQQLHQPTVADNNDEIIVAKAWIAVRDTVELGKSEYRFSENQLMYHYTKDLKYLRAAMDEASTDSDTYT